MFGLPKEIWIKIFEMVVSDFKYFPCLHFTISKSSACAQTLTRKREERNTAIGCGDEKDVLEVVTTMAKTKSRIIYSAYDLGYYPPIYFIRLVCKSFKYYVDEYNKLRKRYMEEKTYYRHPFERWHEYNRLHEDGDNPYKNRPFIRPDDSMEKIDYTKFDSLAI